VKVRELQQQLSKLDPDLEVVCYCEDEALLRDNRAFVLLDISVANATRAVRSRLDDGTPYLTFDNEKGNPIATLEVTSQF
jgi:hypothetical protein